MSSVANLEHRRREILARELAETLLARGAAVRDVTELEDIELWRSAARRAGRILGWSVRTGLSQGPEHTVVWVTSDDFTMTPSDRKLSELLVQQRMNEALRDPRRPDLRPIEGD